ncbi:MAG: hypothetical protein M3N43_14730 [Actinomycetota bacterium]|nr:hypothetical protein [Actinomycetota bacterium]
MARLRWRLLAALMWTPNIEAMYHTPPLKHGSARERLTVQKGRETARAVHDSLFPTDPPDEAD